MIDIKTIDLITQAIKLNKISLSEAENIISNIYSFELNENILAWGKYYFPDKFTLPFCYELHNYFIDIKDEQQTVTYAPRGYAKTTIKCFLIPIYLALNYPNKYKFYFNIQATATMALAVNRDIQEELENNEKLIKDYGYQVGEKWTEKKFILRNGVIFACAGAGESIRGIQEQNKRPDYIIIDDLYSEEDIHNPKLIQKKNNWFWATVYKCVSKDNKFCIHIQGTAIHSIDLISKLKDKNGWKYKKFQAIKDYDKKEVLWKEADSFDKLVKDKISMGTIIFNREMQNEPRSDETSIIKETWIKYYDILPPFEEDLKKSIKEYNKKIPDDVEYIIGITGACDPSLGRTEFSDFTAISCIFISNFGNYYIHEIINSRSSINERKEILQRLHNKYNFHIFKIEAIAGFGDFAYMMKHNTNLPIKEITAVKDKISRLEMQGNKFENGKVLLNKNMNAEVMSEAIYQLINNEPEHDDIRDSIILGLEDSKKTNLHIGFI